ncbi:MAG: chemotaxis protein CheB [Ferruginibacter sp.]
MNIIVIGGSAGAIKSLKAMIAMLPSDIDAAVFVVIHIPPDKPSNLPNILSTPEGWKAKHAVDSESISVQNIYVARPGCHLLIEEGKTLLGKGPTENRFRPSIDVLFRSAALAYGSQVTGILLSGVLDDGTAGLSAVKKMNGTVIIQHPDDAEFTGMPLNALQKVGADHCVPAMAMGPLLSKLPTINLKQKVMKNDAFEWENNIALGPNSSFSDLNKFASPTRYICPDCEGPLFRMKDEKLVRYRCFVGHAVSEETLLNEISEKLDHLLWTTYRTLDEKREMIDNLAIPSEGLKAEKLRITQQMESFKDLLGLASPETISK